jgi:hypothetical protein
MKKFIAMVMFMVLSVGLFAEGQSEASAALANELTATIREGKGVVDEFAPKAVEGMVAAKRAYYDAIFPTIQILTLIGIAVLVLGVVFYILENEAVIDITSTLWVVLIIIGTFMTVICGVWSLIDMVEMRMFDAAPEVYVIKSFLSG